MTEPVFDFDAWLDGASPTTTSVDILQNPSLLGKYEDWQRRYQRAKNLGSEELGIGEVNPVTALEAEGEQLLTELEQSRAVWHVRGLTGDDDKAIRVAHPDPKPPAGFDEQPPKIVTAPTEAQAKAFSQGYEAWQHRQQAWVETHRAEIEKYGEDLEQVALARGAERISRAIVKVEQAGRIVTTHITAEQALALPQRIGEPQVAVLIAAIGRASTEVPEVPMGPLSHGSGTDQE